VAADLFADADLQRECPVTKITDYPAGLADWLSRTECAGWLYTGALENHPDLIDRMAELRPLLGNRGAVLRRVRDPLELQKFLRAANLNFPETKPCDGSAPGEGAWLHKTGQGGNGSGVRQCDLEYDELPTSGYWQQRIDGIPGSALFVGDTLHGITRQLIGEAWTGAGEFQYCGARAPWNLPFAASADLTHLGQVLTMQFHLSGLFGVDFVFDGKCVWIIEVNPRVTAAVEVVERTSGVNLLAKHLAAFGIAVENSAQTRAPSAGKAILYAKQSLAVSRSLSDQLLAAASSLDDWQLADIPHADTMISAGEPILSVLSDGTDSDDVETKLRERVAELEREFYRDGGGT
jgi:predicted ATP-grasp superfamily ATP-dependent carboligase